jgi:sensor histidine kinase YesM
MLLQPLIENAIMHGIVPKESKGKIDIYFDYLPEKKSLSCTIKDNGIGYFESIKIKKKSVLQHHSMALEVLKNRVEAIGGSFNIEEYVEQNQIAGTIIAIQLNK